MRFIPRTGTAAVSSLLALLLTLGFGNSAYAQGLGEITADSGLNQPLRAHIDLLDVSKLDATQIKVALATDAEFDLARVTRGASLSQLKFQVEMQRDGTGRILVTTNDAIAEPFLDFLVGVTWPTGRTLREYTLLLDLAPNRAAAPRTSSISNNAAGSSSSQSAADTKEYEVQKGDTLYQIAEQTRPSSDVGVQQMMVAIQRANEGSFVNNNVNRIMTGKVLRIPRQDEIALIDQEAAVAQINQQNQELDAQPLAVNDSTGANAAASRDELTLLSGDQDAGGGGSRDLDATIKSLQNQVMLSEESLDRSTLENLELTNRLNAVQEQIDLLQNIIAIEDERIAQLQKQLSSQSAATKDALASAESAAQTVSNDAGEGIVGLLSDSVVWLGGLLAVVAGIALMLFIKRRNAMAADADAEVSLDDLADANEAERSGGVSAMIAAFMARFRRPEAAEVEEPVFAEEASTAAAVAVEPDIAKPEPVAQPTTNKLLDEMGFSDDFMDLENALDEVESTSEASHPNAVSMAPVTTTMPARDTAVEEAGAVMEEAALLERALDEAEEEVEETREDSLQTAAESTPVVAVVPETFAFTPDVDEAAEEAEEVAAAPVEDKPEVFEFTLPNLEDLDDDEDTAVTAAEPAEKVESISFNPSALTLDADDSDDDALEMLSFDEDSAKLAADAEDDSADDESVDLSGPQDTHDARLDLAVAYEAMGDIDGAVEILEEVIASGKGAQISEAMRLKQKWQNG